MSQITLWKSIKTPSLWFPSFAPLLPYTSIPVAERVSLLFLFLLSFSTKTSASKQALVELEHSTNSFTLDHGHGRDQVLITQISCFINTNDKGDIELQVQAQKKTNQNDWKLKREKGRQRTSWKIFMKFLKRKHWRAWSCLWAMDIWCNLFTDVCKMSCK